MTSSPPSQQPDHPRRRVLAAVGLLIAGCAGNPNRISPPEQPLRAATVRSGERWRYQRINRFNNEPLGEILAEVIQVQPQVIVQLTDQAGQDWGREIYSAPWQIIQEPFYNQTLRFAEPVPLLPPLPTGSQPGSTRTSYQIDSGNRARPWTARLETRGWERISVPAGQYDCLRVERTIYFQPEQASRFDARRVETLWYAPAVNRWVKRDWTGFYLDETTLSDRRTALPLEDREDSVSWILLEHQPAPIAG
ncbi:MAG: hypothetical protein ACRBC3_09540 [Burkholderiaceae bacterium]